MTETNDGLCFCQLGELHCSETNDFWKNTDLVVVIRITVTGAPNGIYIIFSNVTDVYDPFDRDPEIPTVKRESIPRSLSSQPFSCARIEGITKLGDCREDYSTPLSWVDLVDQPLEIVRAVRNPEGLVLHATVEKIEEVQRGSSIERGNRGC
ncbi:hypothetical protein BFW01_g423 [Lasiodiplodia theobromae]|uniref:Uncharacterized protein n=1 Tax=Lasiodiplodia theobromae TaxID=45133 RepID=A0A8H7IRZ5_9PEZI|nr:hypothetical protein BFW01_g423 [Lasiodiplodia theobromae]